MGHFFCVHVGLTLLRVELAPCCSKPPLACLPQTTTKVMTPKHKPKHRWIGKKQLQSLLKRSPSKKFWLALIVSIGVTVGFWLVFSKKKSKNTTAAQLDAKTLPNHTLLVIDLLEGFGENEMSIVDGKVSAPYIEKQIDFAATEGLDGILIAIPIDHVYRNSPDTPDWTGVEHVFNYAHEKGLFILSKLRIEPYKSYLYPDFNISDFVQGNTSVKLESNFWTTYAKKFATDYKEKFQDWHTSNRILCVFPTSTIHQEWGYGYDTPLHESSYGERIKAVNRVMHEMADVLSPLSVGVDSGSYYDTAAATHRGTCAVSDLANRPNIVCVKDNPHIDYDLYFDHALLLSTAKKNGANSLAMAEHTNSPPGQVTPQLIDDIRLSYELGIDIVGLAFVYDEAGHHIVKDIVNALKQSNHYRSPKPTWNPVGEFSYTTSELKNQNGYQGQILTRFRNLLQQNANKLPKITVINDL